MAVPSYRAKDYSHLLGMAGFSKKALESHFKLYQGYATNANLILDLIRTSAPPAQSELRRRLGWELDGLRLHELYFDNLGGKEPLSNSSPLYKAIQRDFGSFENWKSDFVATGAMRGVGWAVLYLDPQTGRLLNMWINEHDVGHLAGGTPILIMDVFEHAYMIDYLLDRKAYIEAFFQNINWQVSAQRYQAEPKST
jgi:superoxide dismutase, Fe-Mn family